MKYIYNNNLAIFFGIVLLSMMSFLIVHPFTLVGGDEGRFVQDALRIGRGEIPIVDYGTRAPILSLFINISSEIFGRSLFVFRLPVMLFSAFSAGMIFLLGTLLVSRKVAIVAALLFALTPVTLWNNVVIKTEALTVLCIIVSAYFFVYGFQRSRGLYLFISGIPLGIAYIERQSVVAFMLTIAAVVIWDAWREKTGSIKKIIERGVLIVGGVVVGFLPIFLFFAYYNFSSASAMWFTTSMFQAGQAAKEAPIDASSGYVSDFWRGWILSFVEILAVQAGILFFALGAFCISIFRASSLFNRQLANFLSAVFGVLFFGAFFAHAAIIVSHGTFRPWLFLSLSIIVGCMLGIFFRSSRASRDYIVTVQEHSFRTIFLLFWMGGLFISYSFFSPGYIREWIPALCFITAMLLDVLARGRRSTLLVGVIVICFWLVGGAWFQSPKTGGWWWTQKTINETASYLNIHTTPDQKIFSANPLPVMIAGRRTVADITSYAIVFSKNADDHFSSFPSPNEMLFLLKKDPPPYVIVDRRMESHFFGTYAFFKDFVIKKYEPEVVFGANEKRGRTEIWRLKK